MTVAGVLWNIVVWTPLGPATTFSVIILKIAPYNGWGRYRQQLVTVDIQGKATVLRPFVAHDCAVGDEIQLRRQRHILSLWLLPDTRTCRPGKRAGGESKGA